MAFSASLGVLLALLFASLVMLRASAAVEPSKPRPTPQMMAPRESMTPELNQGGRVSYASVDPAYVVKGGY